MDISELFPSDVVEELGQLDSHVTEKRRQSLPELLRAWSRYVNRLSRPEPVDLDDYVGMLFARDAIQDIMQLAAPTGARVLEALTTLDDAHFLFCTMHDQDNILGAMVTSIPSHWWWHRIPLTRPPASADPGPGAT